MTTTRRLAAILAADVAGYSAAMEKDEEGTAAAVRALRRDVIEPGLAEHQGRLIKTTGDGFLAEFASPIAALKCALAIQQRPDASSGLRLRIGLNLGDVIIEESGDLLGEGVNVAARLEGLAEPGGILISGKIYSEVEGKVEAEFVDRGEQQVKNITKPVRAYAVRTGAVVSAQTSPLADFGKPLPLPDKPSIAVLPFQNMSGDPEQDYFADGIVEDIITALSRFQSLFVIARNSSFTYKGKPVDIRQVGRDLGVRYVLEGSVRKAGGRVRITGQLIEAATNNHLWADRFDGSLEDVFELQDKVTSSVVGTVAPRIQRAEIDRSKAKPTTSLQAYDWYLRGLAAADRFGRDESEEAIRLFKRAIELDPNYATAMARIAYTYAGMALQGWLDDKRAAEAIVYLKMAQERSRNDADVLALCAVSMTISAFNADHEAANLLADQSISLNPNNASGWIASGFLKRSLGNHQVAIEHFHRALQLNPFDPLNGLVMTGLGWANFLLQQYDESRKAVQKALSENPNHLPALRLSAALYSARGDLDSARKTAERILRLNPAERISNLIIVRSNRRIEDRETTAHFLRLAGLPE